MKMRWMNIAVGLMAVGLWVGGCTSPPGAGALIEAANRAMQDEVMQLQADQKRDQIQIEQTRKMLETAFEEDLQAQSALTQVWVHEAMVVYVAAREEVLRQEMKLQEQRKQRIENLQLASKAQQRAWELLTRQDDLIVGVLGVDWWRLNQNKK